jgi:Fe-S-cluster containining protein
MKLKLLDDNTAPWYAPDGLAFTCTCCGNCCTGGPGYVWMSSEEVDRLAAHLGLSRAKTLKEHCRTIGGRVSLKEHRTAEGNFDCTFLKEIPGDPTKTGSLSLPKRVCGIYAVRPLQCRTWPFWDGNLASRENWDRAGRRCPGMNTGKHYTPERIEALRDAPDWPDAPPTSRKAPRRGK